MKLPVEPSYTNNIFFLKNGGQEGKTDPTWELAPVGGVGYKESE
jgi:hypothetical protein